MGIVSHNLAVLAAAVRSWAIVALLTAAGLAAPQLSLAADCDIDLESGSWSDLADLPIDRHENATAKIEIGGLEYIFYFAQRNKGSVVRYDITNDTWATSDDAGAAGAPPLKPPPFAPPLLGDHKKALSIGNLIYIIGGTRPFDDSVWTYDGINPATQLSNIGCSGAATSCAGQINIGAFAAALLDGEIYIAGGHCNTTGDDSANCTCEGIVAGTTGNCAGNATAPGENTDRAFRYDPVGDDWFPIADMPIAVDHASGAAFGGKFYVFAGRQCGTDTACEGRTHTQIYNPATDSWSFGAPVPEGCSGMGHAAVMNDRMYLFGGEGGACSQRAVQEYDPAGDSWRTLTSLPDSHHGMTPIVVGDPTDGIPDRILVGSGRPLASTRDLHEFQFTCEPCGAGCASCSSNGDCDDGAFCNGTETCNNSTCEAGVAACPGQACDESADACVDCTVDADCDNGNACDGDETCSGNSCQAGTPLSCGDGDLCTTDSCHTTLGCVNTAVDCGDGNLCTADSCNPSNGSCEHTPIACDDPDNDGLLDDDDPCPGDPRNLCVGDVAIDASTGNAIRINANVSADECSGDKTDCNGDLWHADYGYNLSVKASSCNLNGGGESCVISGLTDLFGCDDETTEDLFQCEHSDNAPAPELIYDFDVPDGLYVVNVFAASTYDGSQNVGDRVFDIIVEGIVRHDDFDQVAAAPGTARAVVRSAVVAVSDGNGLQIELGHVVENPAIKAIEVLSFTNCTIDADCNDGAYCNGAETCSSGSCIGGLAPNCSDGVSCTIDSCNESTDSCDHTPNNGACSDGAFCNGTETCHASLGCQSGSAPNCSDGISCTADSCNESTDSCNHTPNNGACSDGAFCNGTETCHVSSGCQSGTAPNCSDGVSCTTDSCNETSDACDNTPSDAACDDGAFCNGVESCHATLDCQNGPAPNCSDGVTCTTDTCNETSDACDNTPSDAACDDGAFCNGSESCDPTLDCQAGTAPQTDDGVVCTVDACDETNDIITHSASDPLCDDGLFCNGAETCHPTNDCVQGSSPSLDDGISCTVDSCDEAGDTIAHVATDSLCDDGAFCNGEETCSADSDCRAGAFPCSDGVTCTTDGCDEDSDACVHVPSDPNCDDGNQCNGTEVCNADLGCMPGEATDCSSLDDACATYQCDIETQGCLATPINEGGSCDDGNQCTLDDTCVAGSCLRTSYCGVPISRGENPTVSDALFALRTTVALEQCPACECDVNATGTTTVADALIILSSAVDLEVTLDCFVPSEATP